MPLFVSMILQKNTLRRRHNGISLYISFVCFFCVLFVFFYKYISFVYLLLLFIIIILYFFTSFLTHPFTLPLLFFWVWMQRHVGCKPQPLPRPVAMRGQATISGPGESQSQRAGRTSFELCGHCKGAIVGRRR